MALLTVAWIEGRKGTLTWIAGASFCASSATCGCASSSTSNGTWTVPSCTDSTCAHLSALLLQPAGALLLPLPTEHGPCLLVRIRLVRHGLNRSLKLKPTYGLRQNGLSQ